jgi:hypothetical protein
MCNQRLMERMTPGVAPGGRSFIYLLYIYISSRSSIHNVTYKAKAARKESAAVDPMEQELWRCSLVEIKPCLRW